MLIRSFKIRRPRIWLVVLAVLAAAAVVFLLITGIRGSKVHKLDSEDRRQAFLHEMGWEIPERFEQVKTVLIPEDWDEVYLNYNKLQKQQGFDLSPYKGMQVQIYTYKVLNYPSHVGEEGIECHLMISDGQLIGGDVCSTALDGFMQGLRCSSSTDDTSKLKADSVKDSVGG